MHSFAPWTKVAAIAAALALTAPAVPAHAVPSVTGSYATVAPAVLRTIDSDACQDMVRLDLGVDLQGLGNAIAAQGYRSYTPTDPVYTKLSWEIEARITGPDNYFETLSESAGFPTNVDTATDTVCPDDFGRSRPSPGTYSVEWTATFDASYLCSTAEGCNYYDGVFTQTGVTSYTLAYSQACLDARQQVTSLTKKLKKAKRAGERSQVRKIKRKLSRSKDRVDDSC